MGFFENLLFQTSNVKSIKNVRIISSYFVIFNNDSTPKREPRLHVYRYMKRYFEDDPEINENNKIKQTNYLTKSHNEHGTIFYNQTVTPHESYKRINSFKKITSESKGVLGIGINVDSEETTTASLFLQNLLQETENRNEQTKNDAKKSASWESIYFMSTIQKEFKRIAKQLEDMVVDIYNDDKNGNKSGQE